MEHINSCKKCQHLLKKKYKCNHNILNKCLKIIEEYKDIIVIFLIGIAILLFFNLIRTIK